MEEEVLMEGNMMDQLKGMMAYLQKENENAIIVKDKWVPIMELDSDHRLAIGKLMRGTKIGFTKRLHYHDSLLCLPQGNCRRIT